VYASPTVAKSFSPATIAVGGVSTLTLTVTNPAENPGSLTGVSLADTYEGSLLNSAAGSLTCSGAGSATLTGGALGGTAVGFSAGTIVAGGTCTLTQGVTATGTSANTTGAPVTTGPVPLTGTPAGPVTLTVSSTPTVAQAFDPAAIAAGGTSALTVTLGNPNGAAIALTDDFTVTLPAGMTLAAAGSTGTCAGVTAANGAGSVSVANGTSLPAGDCTVVVTVTSTTPGTATHTVAAGALATSAGSSAGPVSDSLGVYAPPTVTKSFSPATIAVGGVSTLTLTVTNPAENPGSLTGVSLADTYSGSLVNAAAGSLACSGAGSATLTGGALGGNSVGFIAGTLVPGGTCTLTQSVTATGTSANTTGAPVTTGPVPLTGAPAGPVTLTVSSTPTVAQAFDPAAIAVGGTSTLTVTLGNPNGAAIALTTGFAVTLPAGVTRTADPLAGTCPGVTAAAAGFTVASGTALPAGDCTVVVTVTSATPGTAAHTLAAGALATDAGNNPVASTATLTVHPLGSLSGRVFLDANGDGLFHGSDVGLAGVAVTLSGYAFGPNGVDDGGAGDDLPLAPVTQSTGPGGEYHFSALVGGRYTVTQPTQPVVYLDGITTAGSLGGAATATGVIPSAISGITLDGQHATGYTFGERPGLAARVSGSIWHNTVVPDKTRQAGEPGLAGWLVEAVQGGVIRGTATSAADGTYAIDNLTAGTGYELRFRHPGNLALFGDPVSQDPAYADSVLDLSAHTIANLTLRSGGNVIEQNLPVDPSGVVYDSDTRLPVPGATVTILGPAGFDPALHLVGGTGNHTQTTGDSGFYQFLLLPGTPAGTYTLAVAPPAGYVAGTSTRIPPGPGPFVPGPGPGTVAIQPQATAPTGSQATTYYLSFALGAGVADVVNNHVPVDPVPPGAVAMTKTTPLVNVTRGALVPYTLTATNTLAAALTDAELVDQVPPGFGYRSGSARLDGVPVEPVVAGRTLRWPGLTFTPQEKKTLRLVLVVGSGVGDAAYTNQAWARNSRTGVSISNTATATVRVVPDPTFDCTDLVGKVFDDRNANGYQDDGEPGIPAVRLATARGWLVTTDPAGRFHVACSVVPQAERGSNFVLKLDPRTLPSGFRLTTENPAVVRATRGKLSKVNFGAAIHRVVRVELDDRAFADDSGLLRAPWQAQFDGLPDRLRERPSVVRLAYRTDAPRQALAQERLDRLREALSRRWGELDHAYPLSIETEVTGVSR
ncbi:MAG: DUF7933 domain-containing protein, partial [Deferrisomatales bacterium]